jgi:VWFA-related protein
MRNLSRTALILLISISALVLVVSPAFSQEITVVRIGVAPLRTSAPKLSPSAARDRIVKLLNQHKPDKKWRLKFDAVALESSDSQKTATEARDKNCAFVLATHLTDLVTVSKYATSTSMSSGPSEVPAFDASVEYTVTRIADGAATNGSVKAEDITSPQDALWQALSQVASKATADLKNRDNAFHGEIVQAENAGRKPTAVPAEEMLIGTDFCAWLPDSISHADALRGVCEYAISLPQKMPNFICQQATSRYRGNEKVPTDLITASVRYEDGNESYSEIKLNGKPAPAATSTAPGLWSTGEFGSNLRAIFDLRNNPVFEFSGERNIENRAVWIFSYEIARQNTPLWRLHSDDQMLAPAYGGELWVDQKTGAVARFHAAARSVPPTFSMQGAELLTGYNNVAFDDGSSFVLPQESSVITHYRGQEPTRNVVEFKECHKFRAKVRMVLDVPARDVPVVTASEPAVVAAALEENENIYTILRQQAVREDDTRLQAEDLEQLNVATGESLQKFAALRKQAILAHQQVMAKTPTPALENALTVLRSSVRMVLVPVVLRDASGHALGNLRKEDFQLYDERKPQAITSFSVEEIAATPSPQPAGDSTPAPATFTSGKPSAGTEHDVALVFDDVHATFGDLAASRDAASRHLAKLLPGDRVALFTTSGRVTLDFTQDRAKLQEALSALRPHPVISIAGCPRVSPYMADLIVNQSDLEALDIVAQDALACTYGGMATKTDLPRAEQIARMAAREVLNASSMEAQGTLGILRDAIRKTAAQSGNRSIVLVSPGFLALAPEVRQAVMELTDRAVRSGIVINTLDMRGLYTPDQAADQNHPDQRERVQMGGTEASAQSEVMAQIADGTGGTYFHNSNDLDEGFRRTAAAPEFIYLLGFSPQKLDGKFHPLKVTLNGQSKISVQARRGYYALKATTH